LFDIDFLFVVWLAVRFSFTKPTQKNLRILYTDIQKSMLIEGFHSIFHRYRKISLPLRAIGKPANTFWKIIEDCDESDRLNYS
jgi:hypothetical protein